MRRASPPPNPSSGLVLSPFRAVRYTTRDPFVLAGLTSPAYDLIDREGREALERTDPHNVVRLILPRPDRAGDDADYGRAASVLGQWRAEGVLTVDRDPALYVYEMADGSARTRGLVGTVGLSEPDAPVILPHEDVMPGPVADRLALVEATQANFEPIVLVHDGGGPSSDVVYSVVDAAPDLSMTGSDGVRHRIWALRDPDDLAIVAADLRGQSAVIADGHHRYASYLRNRDRRRAAGDGAGPWDRALAYLVPAGAHGPRVEAIHRVLPGIDLGTALQAARSAFLVRPVRLHAGAVEGLLDAQSRTAFVLTDGESWHLLSDPDPDALTAITRADDGRHSTQWLGLDVTIAHQLLIAALIGRADDDERVLLGHDVTTAVASARRTAGVAVLLRATSAESVLAVARNGERMPRKSTLFVPKPRTGLLMRCYADERWDDVAGSPGSVDAARPSVADTAVELG
ncbi:MAG: DUF1015 domain-containing protein [Geodermatophilaceae bacterium]|nr:DUF1015 domain-containing protein [Geodermatophilaceae bacterium]